MEHRTDIGCMHGMTSEHVELALSLITLACIIIVDTHRTAASARLWAHHMGMRYPGTNSRVVMRSMHDGTLR